MMNSGLRQSANKALQRTVAVGAILLMASNTFAMRSLAYLETIDLDDLCVVYPKNHQGFWVASAKDPDGYFHTVTVGSYIGKNYGRIEKITKTEHR